MSDFVKKNAVIESTFLGFEDHGILTFYLYLDFGGKHQGGGGICLSGGYPEVQYAEKGLECIALILKTVGVNEWEKLKGRSVVALYDDDGWGSTIRGIENFLGTKRVIWKEVFGT